MGVELSNKKGLDAEKKKRPKTQPRNDYDKEKRGHSEKGHSDGGAGTPGSSTPPLTEEPISSEDQQLARMRRGHLNTAHTVDKQVLKGAASKLATPSPGQAFRSFIRS